MAPDFSALFVTLLFVVGGMIAGSALLGFALALHWVLRAVGVL